MQFHGIDIRKVEFDWNCFNAVTKVLTNESSNPGMGRKSAAMTIMVMTEYSTLADPWLALRDKPDNLIDCPIARLWRFSPTIVNLIHHNYWTTTACLTTNHKLNKLRFTIH